MSSETQRRINERRERQEKNGRDQRSYFSRIDYRSNVCSLHTEVQEVQHKLKYNVHVVQLIQ